VSRRHRSLLLLAPAAALLGLSASPASAAVTNDPEVDKQAGLIAIKAPEAWPRGKGGGIRVAVVSSGVAEHPDLENKTEGGFDATGGEATEDNIGRGTHLAGIVGAQTNNSLGIAGVAPDAGLVPHKAYRSDGSATGAQLRSALDNVLGSGSQVALVDVPEGLSGDDRAVLVDSLRKLGGAGVSVVVGARSGLSLGDLPVLAVASTSGGASVGERGVAAPGGSVHSTTVTTTLPLGASRYGYGTLSGTSQAAAHVAGAVAILRGLGADATRAADLLRATARKGGSGTGAGTIDVAAAAAAQQAPPPGGAQAPPAKKGEAPPNPTTTTTTSAPPAGQVVPAGPLFTGEPVEPGAGEAAVVPPGAEEFADGGTTFRPGPSIPTAGKERPWGPLTLGFGLLFGVGTAMSLTFRRLAYAPG